MPLSHSSMFVTKRTPLSQSTRHIVPADCVAGGMVLAPELMAEDLRLAVRALGEVAGHVGVEEMLDRLFAGFCIGK